MKLTYKITILIALAAFAGAQSLNEHFRIAAERDPALQAAYKEVEIAMEKAVQVAALPDPGLSFGYFILPVETRLGPQRFKVSLTQMFPWFGTLKARKNAATLEAEAAFSSFKDLRNRLYAELASDYYPLLELECLIAAQREILENLKSLRSQSQSRLENGSGDLVNLLRIKRELDAVQSELRILLNKKTPLEAAFNAYLNRSPDTPVILLDDLNELGENLLISDAGMLDNHPVLEAMDLRIEANAFSTKAALRDGLPKFGLGLDYVAVGERSDMVVAESGRDVLMPMLSVSLPLARGKYKAAVQSRQLKGEQLARQKEALANDLLVRKAQIEFALEREKEQVALMRSQIKRTDSILEILMTRYAQDGSEVEELLRVWREKLNYEKKLASALSGIRIQDAALLALSSQITY